MKTKLFKDYSIEDFSTMKSLSDKHIAETKRPFFGFNKQTEGAFKVSHYPVSNLADVL